MPAEEKAVQMIVRWTYLVSVKVNPTNKIFFTRMYRNFTHIIMSG